MQKQLTTKREKMLIGKHEDEIWTVIYVHRSKKIRLISARAANKKERAAFSSANYGGGA